ncbi:MULTISPECIES: GAF domain-containing protein [Trichocoleus]|uniref:GAF domain-containing protein n=1 Tax=Trichocoleus desertorum GB2-A4 TaxID=2933944 RepID=A0ABV0J9J5_9CYAN|nr:GAF domain-containing protein [Trichocoleus sp. FACHB-46]
MTEPKPVLEACPPSLATSPRANSSEFDFVLAAMLETACETMNWEYGEAWIAIDDKVLQISSTWQTQTRLSRDRKLDWESFHACSQKFVLHAAEGLPGRVWASQTPEWMVDVSAESESYFLRHQIAKAFGAKAGLGLPVIIEQLQVVLVFFRSEAHSRDQQCIDLTEAAVAQIQAQLLH